MSNVEHGPSEPAITHARRDFEGTIAFARFANGRCVYGEKCPRFITRSLAAGPVFAHYMLWAPAASDDIAGFKTEIQYAQDKGIDAFALNTNAWNADIYRRRADMIYNAAQELGTGFKIFFSLDMHRDGNGYLSTANVQEMITRYSSHPSQFYFNGKQFVSTWLGSDDNTFDGFSTALGGWNNMFNQIGGKSKYYLVPFFPTGGTQSEVTGMLNKFGSLLDGLFAWDTSAWPYFNGDFNNPSSSADQAYLAACNQAGKSYMASVSPWFFKNVGDCCSSACTNPQNQVDCSCQVKGNYQGPGLWLTRWQQIVATRPAMVEIVTWNDWVERSYVARIFNPNWGPQESNDVSFPHQAFLALGTHYIKWYKTGTEPAITSDSMFIFYYSMSKSATAPSCRPMNVNTLDDRLYIVTKLKSAATVQITSGSTTQSFNVGAGLKVNSIPLQEGQQSAVILRNNAQVLQIVGDKSVSNSVSKYDYNVYCKSVSVAQV